MGTALIAYSVLAIAVLVLGCLSSRRLSVDYVIISRSLLNGLMRWRDDLIVIDLNESGRRTVPGALHVPAAQLRNLLRWMPRGTMLVLCGVTDAALRSDDIRWALLSVGIESVYVLENVSTSPAMTLAASVHRFSSL